MSAEPPKSNASAPSPKRSFFGLIPQFGLGRSVRSFLEAWQMLVLNLALVLISFRALPKDYLESRPTAQLRLFGVLLDGWRFTPKTHEQIFPLLALGILTALCLGFMLVFVLLITSILAGSAQAQTPPASPDMFTPAPTDGGSRWLSHLFALSPEFARIDDLGMFGNAIQLALKELLRTFSVGMLVIGSAILLYHLVVMIAETAHKGKPFGEADQIWGPLRLVVAIGLLVPMTSGLNSGQYVILKVAEWGSGFASYAWDKFTTASNQTTQISMPSIPRSSEAFLAAYRIGVCYQSHIYQSQVTGIEPPQLYQLGLSQLPPGLASDNTGQVPLIMPYVVREQGAQPICGRVMMNNISTAGAGNDTLAQTLRGFNAIQQASSSQYLQQAFQAGATVASYFHPASDSANAGQRPPASLATNFYQLIDDYHREIALRARTYFEPLATAQGTVSEDQLVNSDKKLGWVEAGAYFNILSRRQNLLTQVVNIAPQPADTAQLVGDGYAAADIAKTVISSLNFINVDAPSGINPADRGETETPSDPMQAVVTALSTNDMKTGLWQKELANATAPGAPGATAGGIGAWLENSFYSNVLTLSSGDAFGSFVQIGMEKFYWSINLMAIAAGADVNFWARWAGFVGLGAVSEDVSVRQGVGLALASTALASMPDGIKNLVKSILWFIIIVGLTASLLVGFLLPLLPFIKFIFGILSWVVNVMEAVVCLPLLALAHINPKGGGIPGDYARRGYFLIFSTFVRPIMTILGLVVAILAANTVLSFLTMFYETVVLDSHIAGVNTNVLTRFIYSIFYLFIGYWLVLKCLDMIEVIPDAAMKWIGGESLKSIAPQHDINSVAGVMYANTLGGQLGAVTKALPGAINDVSSLGRSVPAMLGFGGGNAPPGSGGGPNNRGPNNNDSPDMPTTGGGGGGTGGGGAGGAAMGLMGGGTGGGGSGGTGGGTGGLGTPSPAGAGTPSNPNVSTDSTREDAGRAERGAERSGREADRASDAAKQAADLSNQRHVPPDIGGRGRDERER